MQGRLCRHDTRARGGGREEFWLDDAVKNVRYTNAPESFDLHITGQCGSTEEELRAIFWLQDSGGSRISHWVGEVVLKSSPKEKGKGPKNAK